MDLQLLHTSLIFHSTYIFILNRYIATLHNGIYVNGDTNTLVCVLKTTKIIILSNKGTTHPGKRTSTTSTIQQSDGGPDIR